MKKFFRFSLLIFGAWLLVACSNGPVTTPKPIESTVAPIVSQPQASPIVAPTLEPTDTPTTAPVGGKLRGLDVDPANFIDDRSDAISLLRSMYNAVNRHEYVRAYSYGGNNVFNPQDNNVLPLTFDQFQTNWQAVTSVQLALGTLGESAGAGQFRNAVSALIITQDQTGNTQTSVGCFLVSLANPGAQGTLPFVPAGIYSIKTQPISADADHYQALQQICADAYTTGGFSPSGSLPPAPDPEDISAQRYLDDRSDATELMRSFFNSINRHEYIRTYSYWSNTSQLPSLNDFENGYANTQSVDLTLGAVNSQGAAGTIYYQVPVGFVVHATDGSVQSFAGCYTLKQPQPANQGVPPFMPMGIDSANVQQLTNGADITQAISTACPAQ